MQGCVNSVNNDTRAATPEDDGPQIVPEISDR